MAKWPERNYHRCEYLVSIGIDPATVAEDGVDSTGYLTFMYGEDGKRIYRSDGPNICRVEWSGEDDYRGFLEASYKDMNRPKKHPVVFA